MKNKSNLVNLVREKVESNLFVAYMFPKRDTMGITLNFDLKHCEHCILKPNYSNITTYFVFLFCFKRLILQRKLLRP